MSNDFRVSYLPDKDFGTIEYVGDSAAPGSQSVHTLQFQNGPVALAGGVNGIQNEQVISLLCLRLRDLNAKFPCRENSLAITHLEEALHWLEARTASRVSQGVEGQNIAHVS